MHNIKLAAQSTWHFHWVILHIFCSYRKIHYFTSRETLVFWCLQFHVQFLFQKFRYSNFFGIFEINNSCNTVIYSHHLTTYEMFILIKYIVWVYSSISSHILYLSCWFSPKNSSTHEASNVFHLFFWCLFRTADKSSK